MAKAEVSASRQAYGLRGGKQMESEGLWSDHVSSFASCVGTMGERRMQEERRSGRLENIWGRLDVLIYLL